jgi:ribonuclease-3 family protein
MEEKVMEVQTLEAPVKETTIVNEHVNEAAAQLLEQMRKALNVERVDASQYSPLALAYMGDGVYELLLRTRVVCEANMQVNKLNKKGSELAMAKTQAKLVELLNPSLTEEERHFIQRGKNAKVVNIPKSCTAREYHLATGFECLMGYLYLDGQLSRLLELVSLGFSLLKQEQNA